MASLLPTEILENIFSFLSGYDVLECRNVCSKWRDVIDGTGNRFWRQICVNDFGEVYKEACRKSNLSWRELHNSLTLWSDVSNADVKISKTVAIDVGKFQMLKNGILSCPQNRNSITNKCDTIAYFDLHTLEECGRQKFDIEFFDMDYGENDNLIVINYDKDKRTMLRVIPKENKNRFLDLECTGPRPWDLLESEVRYVGPGYSRCSVKLVRKDDDVDLLTDSFDAETNAYRSIFNFALYVANQNCYFLNIHLTSIVHKSRYDKLYIIGTCKPHGMLHMFYNPYDCNNQPRQRRVSPDKSVNLDGSYEVDDVFLRRNHFVQTDVIEILNGHKIVILRFGRIFVVELTHVISPSIKQACDGQVV